MIEYELEHCIQNLILRTNDPQLDPMFVNDLVDTLKKVVEYISKNKHRLDTIDFQTNNILIDLNMQEYINTKLTNEVDRLSNIMNKIVSKDYPELLIKHNKN